jgi:hypothetical protein
MVGIDNMPTIVTRELSVDDLIEMAQWVRDNDAELFSVYGRHVKITPDMLVMNAFLHSPPRQINVMVHNTATSALFRLTWC